MRQGNSFHPDIVKILQYCKVFKSLPYCSIFTILGWNEFPCCIRNYSYLLLLELPSHARPANGIARSLFKDLLFITITTVGVGVSL